MENENKNYMVLGMDYNEGGFARMRIEWSKNKRIMWECKAEPKFLPRKNEYKMSKRANNIHIGDIVYFYVFNLPKDKLARILLRGEVEDSPTPMKKKDIYFLTDSKEDMEKMTQGFPIGKLTTLPKKELENDNYLSLDDLKRRFNFKHPQGSFWPSVKNDNELLDELENVFKKQGDKRDFETLIKHFSRGCFFEDKDNPKNISNHKTFMGRKGLDYYEEHHFIPRFINNKKKGDPFYMKEGASSIIDDSRNKITLCSVCHNKLHYGMVNDIDEMLYKLWNDEKIQELFKEKDFISKIGVDNEDDALDWIRRVYKLDDIIIKGKE